MGDLKGFDIDRILLNALHEDIGTGDVTTLSVVPEKHISKAFLISKDEFILAGIPFAERTFKLLDSSLKFRARKRDGSRIKKQDILATISGNTRSLLMAERVALNILQRLSGVATLTHKYVKCVKGLSVKIVDTRKTIPGIRLLDKYAVRIGGGVNHRSGLYDGVLIKDNHIVVAGGMRKAIRLARLRAHHLLKIEVEVKSMAEVKEAVSAGVDVIMLDNMTIGEMRKAVDFIRRKNPDIIIEVSGGVRLEDVHSVAAIGVDLISVGAITHSAPAPDIGMEIRHPSTGLEFPEFSSELKL